MPHTYTQGLASIIVMFLVIHYLDKKYLETNIKIRIIFKFSIITDREAAASLLVFQLSEWVRTGFGNAWSSPG